MCFGCPYCVSSATAANIYTWLVNVWAHIHPPEMERLRGFAADSAAPRATTKRSSLHISAPRDAQPINEHDHDGARKPAVKRLKPSSAARADPIVHHDGARPAACLMSPSPCTAAVDPLRNTEVAGPLNMDTAGSPFTASVAPSSMSSPVPWCEVCISAPCDVLLWPCRHVSCCESCAVGLIQQSMPCPLCPAAIQCTVPMTLHQAVATAGSSQPMYVSQLLTSAQAHTVHSSAMADTSLSSRVSTTSHVINALPTPSIANSRLSAMSRDSAPSFTDVATAVQAVCINHDRDNDDNSGKGERLIDGVQQAASERLDGLTLIQLSTGWNKLREIARKFDDAANDLFRFRPCELLWGEWLPLLSAEAYSSTAVGSGVLEELQNTKMGWKIVGFDKVRNNPEREQYQQAKAQLAGLVALIGAVTYVVLATGHLQDTKKRVEQQRADQGSDRLGDIELAVAAWKKGAAEVLAVRDKYELSTALDAIKTKMAETHTAMVAEIKKWVDYYQLLASELELLPRQLVAAASGGRLDAHQATQHQLAVSSSSAAAGSTPVLPNPWQAVAALIQHGHWWVQQLNHGKAMENERDDGKEEAQVGWSNWQLLEKRFLADKHRTMAAAGECAEAVTELESSREAAYCNDTRLDDENDD